MGAVSGGGLRRLARVGTSIGVLAVAALSVYTSVFVSEVSASSELGVGRHFPVFGPRLAGGDVLWTVPRVDGGYSLRRGAIDGDARRTVLEARGRPRMGLVPSLQFVASPSEVLLQQFVFDSGSPAELAGPRDLGSSRLLSDGSLERLSPQGCCGNRAIDLDGRVGVFPSPSGGARVRDFSLPPETAFDVTDSAPIEYRIAGRYLAYVSSTTSDLVVYDIQTRAESYRVRADAVQASGFGGVDVQADGKIAFRYGQGDPSLGRTSLGWASPAEPVVHPLGVSTRAGSFDYALKLADDVVVYQRADRRGGLSPSATDILASLPLQGGSPRTLARYVVVPSPPPDEAFDYDGDRVAWVAATCKGPQIRVADLDALKVSGDSSRRRTCRLQLRTKPTITKKGVLTLRFGCVGFAMGCRVQDVELRTDRRYRVRGRPVKRGTRVRVRRLKSNSSRTVRLRLSSLGRRLTHKAGPLRLVVGGEVLDGNVNERRGRRIAVR